MVNEGISYLTFRCLLLASMDESCNREVDVAATSDTHTHTHVSHALTTCTAGGSAAVEEAPQLTNIGASFEEAHQPNASPPEAQSSNCPQDHSLPPARHKLCFPPPTVTAIHILDAFMLLLGCAMLFILTLSINFILIKGRALKNIYHKISLLFPF